MQSLLNYYKYKIMFDDILYELIKGREDLIKKIANYGGSEKDYTLLYEYGEAMVRIDQVQQFLFKNLREGAKQAHNQSILNKAKCTYS